MLNYESIADERFNGTERTAVKAMVASFMQFAPDEFALSEKSQNELMEWCAAGGLNYMTTQRRLRWCAYIYESAGLVNPVANVAYRDLNFSADLKKHYFKDEEEMLDAAKRVVALMPNIKSDTALMIPAILALGWEGFSQADMLSIQSDGVLDGEKCIISFGGRKRRLSKTTFDGALRELFRRRNANNDSETPLFVTADGSPWKHLNFSELIHRVNKVAIGEFGKEFILAKLDENGVFERIRRYREDTHERINDATSHVLSSDLPRWRKRSVVSQGYEHWEKYYY